MERNMRGQARKNLTESVSPPKEGGILLGRESEKKGHHEAFTDFPERGHFKRFLSLRSSLFGEEARQANDDNSDKFCTAVIREQRASCDKIIWANFLEDLIIGLVPEGYV